MAIHQLTLRRFLVRLPPVVLTILGLAMLASAPAAWGKGDSVDLPAWMPATSAVLFGLPAVIIGVLFLREVVRRTRADFGVGVISMLGALLALAVAIALEVALLMRVGDAGTYHSLRDASGNVTTTPAAFMVYTVIGVLIMSLLVAGAAYIYRQAITPEVHRFDRRPDERDNIGEMLRHGPLGHA
jgi:hypothetical protein